MAAIGDKFVIRIGKKLQDRSGNEYYFMEGFNTLMFDEKGIKKLTPLTTDEVYKMAERKANADLVAKLKDRQMVVMSQEAYTKDLESAKELAAKKAREETEKKYSGYMKAYDELAEKARKYDELVNKEIKIEKTRPEQTKKTTSRTASDDFDYLNDLINEIFGIKL